MPPGILPGKAVLYYTGKPGNLPLRSTGFYGKLLSIENIKAGHVELTVRKEGRKMKKRTEKLLLALMAASIYSLSVPTACRHLVVCV